MSSKIVFAPEYKDKQDPHGVDIFLAGSIEMGVAADWQTMLGYILSREKSVGRVFNPRRKSWDSSWEQTADNPQFVEQVNWELDHIAKSDITFINFVGGTKSPITLAEFGFLLGAGKFPIVCCPKDFWRVGNVEIMCKRSNVQFYNNYEEAIDSLIHGADVLYQLKQNGVIWN